MKLFISIAALALISSSALAGAQTVPSDKLEGYKSAVTTALIQNAKDFKCTIQEFGPSKSSTPTDITVDNIIPSIQRAYTANVDQSGTPPTVEFLTNGYDDYRIRTLISTTPDGASIIEAQTDVSHVKTERSGTITNPIYKEVTTLVRTFDCKL